MSGDVFYASKCSLVMLLNVLPDHSTLLKRVQISGALVIAGSVSETNPATSRVRAFVASTSVTTLQFDLLHLPFYRRHVLDARR